MPTYCASFPKSRRASLSRFLFFSSFLPLQVNGRFGFYSSSVIAKEKFCHFYLEVVFGHTPRERENISLSVSEQHNVRNIGCLVFRFGSFSSLFFLSIKPNQMDGLALIR